MKKILIVHEHTQYDLARRLIHVLTVSGYDVICTQDLFAGNTGVEIREDIEKIYSATGVFIILADIKIFQSDFHIETIHDAKKLRKYVPVLVEQTTAYPDWFVPKIIHTGRPSERLWNQILESIKPFFLHQPLIVHPETAKLYNLH